MENSSRSSSSVFRPPTTPCPPTPVSNFTLSFSLEDDDDDDDVENNDELLALAPPPKRRHSLLLDGDDDEESILGSAGGGDTDVDFIEDFDSIVGGGGRSSAISAAIRRQRLRYEGRDEHDSQDGLNDVIMSLMWSGNRIGVAYYQWDTAELYLLPDTAEANPDYYILRSIFRQVLPRYLVINSAQDERLLKVACEICGDNLSDSTEQGEETPPTAEAGSSKLITLNSKLFSPEGAKARVLLIKLPSEPKDSNDADHELYMGSLIPLGNERMMRAAGALLQFLDKRARELFQISLVEGHVPVLDIKMATMDEIVMVDDTAWHSLQIFSLDTHPSTMKQANYSSSKEGISIYSILNQGTTTGMGARALRLMLLRPSRNLSVIGRRADVVEYCANPRRLEFTKSATDCLKAIKSIPKLLYKLTLLHASVVEWKELYQTLYYCLLLGEICSAQTQTIAVFKELADPETLEILKDLSSELTRVIDFEESVAAGRVVARHGVESTLDIKKQQLGCLADIMTLVAREELQDLPGFVHRCSITYIPEVGYLLSVVQWRADLTIADTQIEGLEFKFMADESVFYKTPRTRELDTVLGDCSVAILELETSIMIYLTEIILKHTKLLMGVGALVAELDCLISMSVVAKSGNLVRPIIVNGGQRLKILNGRHPLVEEICDFVPNSTRLKDEERVVMITGPNASGKSIYLKQVAVISMMALSGAFVPATYARIPAFDRISTRIHATESVSTGYSSFMIDLSQMSMALRTATASSLVIIDEFGKGTAEADGLALLAASVNDFLEKGEESPLVFLSTHFYSLVNYLHPSPVIKQQSMKFLQQQENRIAYLYELIDGLCPSSLAGMVAEQIGIPRAIICRATDVELVIRNQIQEKWLAPTTSKSKMEDEAKLSEIGDQFLKLNLDEEDPSQVLDLIKKLTI